MKLFKTILLLILISGSCFAQTISCNVISPGGRSVSNSSGALWGNIGEIAISTYTGAGNILTEGFIQPQNPVVTAFNEPVRSSFMVFPNPANDNIYLTFDYSPKIEGAKIFNLQGQIVLSNPVFQKITDFKYMLNISFLEKGVYFLKIADQAAMHKFQIIRLVKI